jgi:alanyl-tRNA synthetase
MAWSTDEIRKTFLEFFRSKGHTVVASSPLIPENDKTLMFTNAGMVQFKDVFTGKDRRPYTRATTAQKCVRAGGKHNDLENVGFTARHHTFFEMLGNFSFGDYFKKDAIELAWNLVTEVYRIPKERLAVTVFKGEDGIPADQEAAGFWRAVGVPEERILWLGKHDNYWQMGPTGPQGPCSEIHYFIGSDPERMLAPGRVASSDGWVEIWNLVFMQFSRDAEDGPLNPLPKPSIDTGAGLERLAAVLQGKTSNYETDSFRSLIDAIAAEIKKPYQSSEAMDDVSMRVIADHSRAAAFLIADGVQPSNMGAGYVLRRIMRRAIRHGDRLGFDELFFHRAASRVVDRMAPAYPELERAKALIVKVCEAEESSFRRTLRNGLKLLDENMSGLVKGAALDPVFVARLYHTYGFPIDLTRVIATERGFLVDEKAAEEEVKRSNPEQEERTVKPEDTGTGKLWYELREKLGPTEFSGYDADMTETTVLGIVAGGAAVPKAKVGTEVSLILARTPFYGESGGQVGDKGRLQGEDGAWVQITDTIKPRPDLHVHHGVVKDGTLAVGAKVVAEIDRSARDATRKNHSATHILHLALKEVLGSHVQQKGSLVAPDRLRFDYAHFEPLTPEQVEAIERRANEMVLRNAPTVTNVCSIEEAKGAGAVMLFGEKYGDRVRMVRIGEDTLELCGGTHVRRSGDIGLIKIVSDAAIASGQRRLEAVTGLGALDWVQRQSRVAGQTAGLLKSAIEAMPDRVEKLQKRVKDLEKELDKSRADAALGGAKGDVLDKVEDLNGVKVLIHKADGTPIKSLRDLSDKLRDRLASGVVVLGAAEEDKAGILVAVTKDLSSRIKAGDVVKAASLAMGGSGGGRPDFAQGGGRAELLEAGLKKAREVLGGA